MSTQTYQDLLLWQKVHRLVLVVYRATKLFPADERYALTSQLRRSVSSIAANIVEGYARHNTKVFLNHLSMAQGSLEETKYHLLVARDLGYLVPSNHEEVLSLAEEVGKLLRSFVKGLSSRT